MVANFGDSFVNSFIAGQSMWEKRDEMRKEKQVEEAFKTHFSDSAQIPDGPPQSWSAVAQKVGLSPDVSSKITDPRQAQEMLANSYTTSPGPEPNIPYHDLGDPSDPNSRFNWNTRPDGTTKGLGYQGVQTTADGRPMSENSVGLPINGREMDIPSIVPGTTPAQMAAMRANPGVALGRDAMGQGIRDTAAASAKGRMAQGKDPFYGDADQASARAEQQPGVGSPYIYNDPLGRMMVADKSRPPTDAERYRGVYYDLMSKGLYKQALDAKTKANAAARDDIDTAHVIFSDAVDKAQRLAQTGDTEGAMSMVNHALGAAGSPSNSTFSVQYDDKGAPTAIKGVDNLTGAPFPKSIWQADPNSMMPAQAQLGMFLGGLSDSKAFTENQKTIIDAKMNLADYHYKQEATKGKMIDNDWQPRLNQNTLENGAVSRSVERQNADTGVFNAQTSRMGTQSEIEHRDVSDAFDYGAGLPTRSIGWRIEDVVTSAVPGVVISGRGRSSARNAEVGGVANSAHLFSNGDMARDIKPPPGRGVTVPQLAAQLKDTLGDNFEVIAERRKGSQSAHVHVEPTKEYAAQLKSQGIGLSPKEQRVQDASSLKSARSALMKWAEDNDVDAGTPEGQMQMGKKATMIAQIYGVDPMSGQPVGRGKHADFTSKGQPSSGPHGATGSWAAPTGGLPRGATGSW